MGEESHVFASDHRPGDYERGYTAGLQAAWEAANTLARAMPTEPVTHEGKGIRNAALDIADAILDLRRNATSRGGA